MIEGILLVALLLAAVGVLGFSFYKAKLADDEGEALPRGMTEFDEWAEDIIAQAALPDNDSMRFALAVAITHLGPTESSKSKDYFVNLLLKGASTQIAFAKMDELKTKQKAASEAALKAQNSEATEAPVAANESTEPSAS